MRACWLILRSSALVVFLHAKCLPTSTVREAVIVIDFARILNGKARGSIHMRAIGSKVKVEHTGQMKQTELWLLRYEVGRLGPSITATKTLILPIVVVLFMYPIKSCSTPHTEPLI